MENKDYQKTSREKRKAQGLIRKEIWVKPSWWKEVKAMISKLKEIE